MQNVTDVDDPLLERAEKVHIDWVELAERETELFREDMAALRVAAARPLRRRRRVDPAGGGPDRAARTRPARSTSVDDDLYFSVTADPRSARSPGWTRDADARDLRRARRRPRARGQARPPRLRRVAGRAARRAGLGQPVRAAAGPGGTSSAPRSRWSTSAPPSTSRPAAATWSSRTTRCAPARRRSRSPGAPFAKAYVPRRDGGLRRREDVEVEGQPGLRLRPPAQRRRPDGDPAGRCCATTTAPTGSGPTTCSGMPSTRWSLAQGAVAGRRRPGRRRSSRRCSPRWPTTSTPRPR